MKFEITNEQYACIMKGLAITPTIYSLLGMDPPEIFKSTENSLGRQYACLMMNQEFFGKDSHLTKKTKK